MQIKTILRLHLILVRMAKIKNSSNSSCWIGCGTKGAFLYRWWECKLVESLWKSIWWFLRKLGIYVSQDPDLGIYTKDSSFDHKDTCSPMLIADLFIITRKGKQPRYSSTEKNG